MQRWNPAHTPLASNADLRATREKEEPLNDYQNHIYRSIVDGFAYLETCTCPDISLSVSALARHMHQPCFRNLKQSKRILRYVAGTLSHGMFYPAGTLKAKSMHVAALSMHAAVDADRGGDIDTLRSTTSYLIAVNCKPIFWRKKRKILVTLS